MAKKRPAFSFPELEQRGRNAILRSADEVRAEEALLQSTDPHDEPAESAAPAEQPSGPGTQVSPARSTPPRARRESDHAGTRARTRASANTGRAVRIDQLRQKLLTKQHLTSYTFRFRPEELERLDRLVVELNQARTTKLSKNDLVRLALSWLLTDYEEEGTDSVLVEVVGRE